VTPTGPVAVNAPTAPWTPAGAASPADSAITGAINSTNPGDIVNSGNYFGQSTMDKVGAWMGNNKSLVSAGMQMAGGLANGAAQGYAADRQFNQQQGVIDRQNANANAQPRINMTVNPNAKVYGNQSKTYNGIIAGARGG
jgi:hypothetical protein